MRVLHLADLHIGKRVNNFNLIEDQVFALREILKLIEREKIECVIVAGDVYDNKTPSSEAVTCLSDFLTGLNKLKVTSLIISGNHDSAEKLAFGADLMKKSNIYISKPYQGKIDKVSLRDEFGPINFFLMPFIKPIEVKRFFPDLEINSYADACEAVLASIDLDEDERNIIISHQFVLGSELSDSEEIFLGGLEAIPTYVYKAFDYAALGHIHKKQSFHTTIKYCGSLLKYSASEVNNNKDLTIIDFSEKGKINFIDGKIPYLRDMRQVKGSFKQIMDLEENDKAKDDYIHVILTDEDEIIDGLNILRSKYPNIMSLRYENTRSLDQVKDLGPSDLKSKSPLDLFLDFYKLRNNQDLSEEKLGLIRDLIKEVWDEG